MQQTNNKHSKKRLLAALIIFGLPVLIIGLVVLALYNKRPAHANNPSKTGAFNSRIPVTNLGKGQKNKLELYLEAEKDSLRREQQLHSDPYANTSHPGSSRDSAATAASRSSTHVSPSATYPSSSAHPDSNEAKVNQHLAKLYAILHSSPPMTGDPTTRSSVASGTIPDGTTDFRSPASPTQYLPPSEVDRLQQIESRLHRQDTGTSPQLRQIDALLSKVLAIQHPEQFAAQHPPTLDTPNVYSVSAKATQTDPPRDTPFTTTDGLKNGFYGLSTEDDDTVAIAPTIRAVIHADQTVQTGSVVKLRLLQDIYLKNVRIPKNAFIFGPCSISNERVAIHLSQVQYNGQVFPIDLKVFDGADGLEGLYVPGAISRDVLKEGAAQNLNTFGVTALDPTNLSAQAAAAGIQTAKDLFSRKIRLITATLKAGHMAILVPAQGLK
jgi:conjugative transposon TraM protein